MNSKLKGTLKNMIYAFSAQAISLMLSILMSLIVPKLLGVEEYGYWQLFLFLIGYVGFSQFGFSDGLYLRIGGLNYADLNHSIIGTQIKITIFTQIVIAIIIADIGLTIYKEPQRQFVWCASAIYLVLFNICGLIGYIFQAVNQTKTYSISVMIDKALFIIEVLCLLITREHHFKVFIIFYISTTVARTVYCLRKAKDILFSKMCLLTIAIKEMWINISVGIKLMLANIASMLILGFGRIIIDHIWGIEAFGEISFSLSLTNFFLLFIQQVSMVLFPALRQTNTNQMNKIYCIARDFLSIFLPIIFLTYIPIRYIIGLWLPQYQESLRYLVLLLPLCTFDGKMQMLCNTYFKVLRKERILLGVNIMAMALSVLLCGFGGYILENISIIVVFMVLAIAIRSVVSELYLSYLMGANITRSLKLEIFLVLIFMISSWFFDDLVSFIIYIIAYMIYLLINHDKITNLVRFSKSVLGK